MSAWYETAAPDLGVNIARMLSADMGCKRGDTLPYKGWKHDYTRDQVLKVFAQAGFTRGAEIGVSEGRFSEAMLIAVPECRLLSIDIWRGYNRLSPEKAELRYQRTLARLTQPQYQGRSEIWRMSSLEASQRVADRSLDWAYIDADHTFNSVMQDILLWAPKVRDGGVLWGHDYANFYRAGVIQAVLAYTGAMGVNPWYVTWETNRNGRTPSWIIPMRAEYR